MASASQDRCLLVATRSKQGIYTVFNIFSIGREGKPFAVGHVSQKSIMGSEIPSSGHGRFPDAGSMAMLLTCRLRSRLDVLDTSWSRSCIHSMSPIS
jgi:hypothetical protein